MGPDGSVAVADGEEEDDEGRRNPLVVARDRLALVIEAGLQRTFETPFEVRNNDEAVALLRDPPPAWVGPTAMRAVDWALGRAVGTRLLSRAGLKVGGLTARKVMIPVTMALEATVSARDGIRELQVMSAYLQSRLAGSGVENDHELIRRTVSALYLQPSARPDLRRPAYQLALGIARQWLTFSVPVPGQRWRRRRGAEQRIKAVGAVDMHDLVQRWHTRRP